jgi:hypothetical protein
VIVLDNLESVLRPAPDSPAVAAFEPEILEKILALCGKLRSVGQTRLIFTSREPLPAPFDRQTIRLGRLSRTEAIELVAKALGKGNLLPDARDSGENDAAIEKLVEAVGCHAGALVQIVQEVARSGVRNATAQLDKLMRDLHARHPNDRERSLLASVELSLRRLPVETRQRIRPLGVFQDGGSLYSIALALQMEEREAIIAIGQQLVGVGLLVGHLSRALPNSLCQFARKSSGTVALMVAYPSA